MGDGQGNSRAVTVRSVLAGLVGVLFICGLSPYNDWIVGNTLLVGNFMPIGLLLFFLIVVIAINAPLRKWRPRWAMSGRELTVALAMALISCGLPGAGLMRYLAPIVPGVWYYGGSNPDHARLMDSLSLPDWLFPDFEAKSARDRSLEPVVQNYFTRVPGVADSFAARWEAVPWRAWRRPIVVWSGFTAVFFGAMACALLIVRRQWVENERLPFPLAGIFAAVVEEPEPGRAVNRMFRRRSFWVAFAGVFLIHSCNAMWKYYPQFFPEIRIRYDLNAIFANEPWVFAAGDFKHSQLLFCMIGIAYFLPSQISLSLWVFFIAHNIVLMVVGSYRVDYPGVARADQFIGALVPYFIAMVWVGRQHWLTVLRQMARGWRSGESRGRYLPYAYVGWAMVGFSALGVGFLMAAGATPVASLVCFFGMLTLNLCIARVVAETGIPFVNFTANLDRAPWVQMMSDNGGGPRTTPRSYFLTQMAGAAYASDMRESPAAYMSHALRLGDDVYEDTSAQRTGWKRARPFLVSLAAAMIVGFIAAGAAKLYTEYNYAVSLNEGGGLPDNYGARIHIVNVLNRSNAYNTPNGPPESHSTAGHLAVGAVISLALSIGRLTSAGFPLHPVGFLLVYTWPLSKIWFSMMIGWLIKTLIVAFGGTALYYKARDFFIGLILGDAAVAAFWLVVALILNAMGLPYKAMLFLPP